MWPSVSYPNFQRLMGLAVLCWNCLHLGFNQMLWERKERWERESKGQGHWTITHKAALCRPYWAAASTILWQLRVNTASEETKWLTTAIWACTKNIFLPSCRWTWCFTWTFLSFSTVKSSSVLSRADSCPGQPIKTTVGKRKRVLGRRGFWKLPQRNKTRQQPPDWTKDCSRPLQEEAQLTSSERQCDQIQISDGASKFGL